MSIHESIVMGLSENAVYPQYIVVRINSSNNILGISHHFPTALSRQPQPHIFLCGCVHTFILSGQSFRPPVYSKNLNAVQRTQSGKVFGDAVPDGVEFPCAVVLVEFSNHHRDNVLVVVSHEETDKLFARWI